jgi:UDP-N-acetylmuramate--alanine ligase
VVVSTAIPDDNPELVAARGGPVITRGRAAAELCARRRQVAIAGTHGKTTTTTMTAAVLAPLDPLVLSGGRLPGTLFNSIPGSGDVAVVEADESDGSFLELRPHIAVVTNLEADHLDRYRDLAAIEAAFDRFAARTVDVLVACVDDAGANKLLAGAPGEVAGYGFRSADVQASDYEPRDGGSRFTVNTPAGRAEVRLPVPGRHNARNALAAISVALRLGRPLAETVELLATVSLPGRRLELVAEVNGARVYDDYGHHPTEVAATLHAARELTRGRLVCVFQPHRYTRLAALISEFAGCFPEADEVILVPVYPAGETPIAGVDSHALAQAIRVLDTERPVTVLDDLMALPDALRARLHAGDVAVCMGAGDIYKASRSLGGVTVRA